MSCINLYRIEREKVHELTQDALKKMDFIKTIERTVEVSCVGIRSFKLTLYLARPEHQRDISWNWILEEFEEPVAQTTPPPKGVVLVESDNEAVYAISFGHSFFTVDKHCDRDFGFEFARRLKYKEIKTTTLTTPSSRRNKTVNTYINYSELEFDSGESFAKLKAKIALAEGFSLYKPAIEIGSSIRFTTADDSLDQVLDLILHVEYTINNCEETCKIPVFSRVKNAEEIQRLDARLRSDIHCNPGQVNISELDIIGATEIFNTNDNEFELKYNNETKRVSSLNNEELEQFCQENHWDYSSSMLDIVVTSYYNGVPVTREFVKNLIDYTDDEEKALLSKGVWYRYNEDYLTYLADSIAEIDVEYHPEYDFSNEVHNTFLEKKYSEEKDDAQYAGKSEKQIRESLKRKYYAERAFNLTRESQDGFQNFDRESSRIGNAKVEAMDLYKNEIMLAVKIGNSSEKLCYAVDQSLTSLKLYKKGELPGMPKVTTAALWFVLERSTHIEDSNGKPDLNKLNMLMLKNRLDHWKKEMRLMGIRPLVYINYRNT